MSTGDQLARVPTDVERPSAGKFALGGVQKVSDYCRMDDQLRYVIAERRRRCALPDPTTRRLLRVRVGLTQADIAAAIGASRPSVSRYEAGVSTPRGTVLRRYLEVLALLDAEAIDIPDRIEAPVDVVGGKRHDHAVHERRPGP